MRICGSHRNGSNGDFIAFSNTEESTVSPKHTLNVILWIRIYPSCLGPWTLSCIYVHSISPMPPLCFDPKSFSLHSARKIRMNLYLHLLFSIWTELSISGSQKAHITKVAVVLFFYLQKKKKIPLSSFNRKRGHPSLIASFLKRNEIAVFMVKNFAFDGVICYYVQFSR